MSTEHSTDEKLETRDDAAEAATEGFGWMGWFDPNGDAPRKRNALPKGHIDPNAHDVFSDLYT